MLSIIVYKEKYTVMNSLKPKNNNLFNLRIINKYITFLCLLILVGISPSKSVASQSFPGDEFSLPKPDVSRGMPLNLTLKSRRSHRRYSKKAISLNELSQLLWSGQGVTNFFGFRTAPSAGALHPLEIYVVVSNVDQLSPGIYHYKPRSHELVLIVKGDHQKQLAQSANQQSSIKKSAATFIITGDISRVERKYKQRAKRYLHIEAGTAVQNIYLQAVSLKLGTVFIGTFKDNEVTQLMQLPADHKPLGLMPIGHLP